MYPHVKEVHVPHNTKIFISACVLYNIMIAVGSRRGRYFLQTLRSSSTTTKIRVRGEYSAREYQLIDQSAEEQSKELIASIRANGNLLWGAKVYGSSENESLDACAPLIVKAKLDIAEIGEMAQGMASLDGLCTYVCRRYRLEQSEGDGGLLKDYLKEELGGESSFDIDVVHGAVQAIATDIPRAGHSVVGQGTFRDGEAGWIALAKDFVTQKDVGAHECDLYSKHGGVFLSIQHLANTSPTYLRSAGGAMAAFVFE